MALVNGSDYDHIDLHPVSGGDVTRHMLKDVQARQDVTDLKSDLNGVSSHALLPVDGYAPQFGTISSAGKWTNVNANYQHIVIPVSGGESMSVVKSDGSSSNLARISVLSAYTVPAVDEAVSFATGWGPAWTTVGTTEQTYTLPNDARYVVVNVLNNGNIRLPTSLIIDGVEYVSNNQRDMIAAMIASATSEQEAQIAALQSGLSDANTAIANNKSAFDGFAKSYLDTALQPLSAITEVPGNVNASGVWNNLNANYQHVVIPVSGGETLEAVRPESAADNKFARITVLKSYTGPVNGEAVDFATGWTGIVQIGATGNIFELPADARYVLVMTTYGGNHYLPSTLKINHVDVAKAPVLTIVDSAVDEAGKQVYDGLYDGFAQDILWQSGTFTQTVGSKSSNSANAARQRMPAAKKFDHRLTIHTDGTYAFLAAFYDDELYVTSKTDYVTYDVDVPANTFFRLVIENAADPTASIAALTAREINQHITVSETQFSDLINPGVSWCAMGDSITEGWYSEYVNGSSTTYNANIGRLRTWVQQVSHRNNWPVKNIGIGGTGYLKPVNNASEGDYTTCGFYLARNTDFTPYNLVTLAYGINDWKADLPLGSMADDPTASVPTTIIQAMRATIEAIMTNNPACKIIVILPLNARGYSNARFGTIANQYARGYTGFSNEGTLDEFADKIIEVCDYYGLQYIDQTRQSAINLQNMETLEPDGVHPSLAGHTLIAHELSKKITF